MCSNSLSKTVRRYPGSVSIPTAWLCSASLLARYPSSFHTHILLSHAQRSNTFSCATLEAAAVPNQRRRLPRGEGWPSTAASRDASSAVVTRGGVEALHAACAARYPSRGGRACSALPAPKLAVVRFN
jgi:hypothetical protein